MLKNVGQEMKSGAYLDGALEESKQANKKHKKHRKHVKI